MKRSAKFLPWVFGFLVATFLFLGLNHFSYFRYENSDDILMVKAFMGFEGGSPAFFQLYQHTFLSYLLGWISTLIPGVAWFSLLQIGCLWISAVLIVKSFCERFSNRFSLIHRVIFSGIFILVFAAFSTARINFTTTAAMLGAASIAVLLSDQNLSRSRLISSLLLLLGCYMLRAQSCLAIFPFWVLALAYLVIHLLSSSNMKVHDLRKPFMILIAGLIVFACLWGIRAIELQSPDLKELIAFQEANAGPMDYAEDRLMSIDDTILEEIGWTRSELALVQQWYFMDENITADAFLTLDEALAADATLINRVSNAFTTLTSFFLSNPRYLICAVLLLVITLFPCLVPKGSSDLPVVSLTALLTLLLTLAMLFYLAFQGRFLSRAADCTLFPCGVILCSLAIRSLDSLQHAQKCRSFVALLLVLLCIGFTGAHAYLTLKTISDRPDYVSAAREEALETYALANSDKLILRTPNLLRDTRLLPDVSKGIPANIMIWGDWNCRTPSWYHQLEQLGFDGRHFTASDFLNPTLLFVTEKEEPPAELMTYLCEFTGKEVRFELVDTEGELHFYSFQ